MRQPHGHMTAISWDMRTSICQSPTEAQSAQPGPQMQVNLPPLSYDEIPALKESQKNRASKVQKP